MSAPRPRGAALGKEVEVHQGGEDKVGGLNRNRNGSLSKGQDGMKIRELRVFLTPNFDTSFVERYERYERNESLVEVVQVALVDQKVNRCRFQGYNMSP